MLARPSDLGEQEAGRTNSFFEHQTGYLTSLGLLLRSLDEENNGSILDYTNTLHADIFHPPTSTHFLLIKSA
jgi:hypothetical protein